MDVHAVVLRLHQSSTNWQTSLLRITYAVSKDIMSEGCAGCHSAFFALDHASLNGMLKVHIPLCQDDLQGQIHSSKCFRQCTDLTCCSLTSDWVGMALIFDGWSQGPLITDCQFCCGLSDSSDEDEWDGKPICEHFIPFPPEPETRIQMFHHTNHCPAELNRERTWENDPSFDAFPSDQSDFDAGV